MSPLETAARKVVEMEDRDRGRHPGLGLAAEMLRPVLPPPPPADRGKLIGRLAEEYVERQRNYLCKIAKEHKLNWREIASIVQYLGDDGQDEQLINPASFYANDMPSIDPSDTL